MRTFFHSTVRPKHVAQRLHHILPSLTASKCRDWTARVLGYPNWHVLQQVTESGGHPITPDLTDTSPDMFKRVVYQEAVARELVGELTQYAPQYELLGTHLLVLWKPYAGGTAKKAWLQQEERGPGPYKLVQGDLLEERISRVNVEWQSHTFRRGRILTQLPDAVIGGVLPHFARLLARDPERARDLRSWNGSVNRLLSEPDVFKQARLRRTQWRVDQGPWADPKTPEELAPSLLQSRDVALFAVSDDAGVVGCAIFRTQFEASPCGRLHHWDLRIENAAVLGQDGPVLDALVEAAEQLFSPVLLRYELSMLGSEDPKMAFSLSHESESAESAALLRRLEQGQGFPAVVPVTREVLRP